MRTVSVARTPSCWPANGERRKDPKLLAEVGAACVERLAPIATQPAGPDTTDEAADEDEAIDEASDDAPPPRSKRQRAAADPRVSKAPFRPDPRIVLGPTLVTGKGCGNGARLPRLAYDEKGDRIRVVGQALSWQLAWGGRHLERRDIAAVSTGPNYVGVVGAIELFVAPRCDSYETSSVHERMAARGLIELVAQADTVAQVRRAGWKVQQGGPTRESFIIPYGVISTPKGPRRVVLYTTKVAESKSFSVHAAAVCPGLEPGSAFVNMCEWEYVKMLRSRAD